MEYAFVDYSSIVVEISIHKIATNGPSANQKNKSEHIIQAGFCCRIIIIKAVVESRFMCNNTSGESHCPSHADDDIDEGAFM